MAKEQKEEKSIVSSTLTLGQIGKKSLQSGTSGAVAMSLQVSSLMWLRTLMNYQYKNGGSIRHSFQTLYRDGGMIRFYRGYFAALAQAPLSRFGDVFSNTGTLALLEQNSQTNQLPIALKTSLASINAGLFRIALMPIDAIKTTKQVHGIKGWSILQEKLKTKGPSVLYHGALGTSLATMVGFFPYFTTYNSLTTYWPRYENSMGYNLLRNASIGLAASFVSDTTSNSLRVIKTCKQTSLVPITYPQAIKQVLAADGFHGLFFRGLQTRILTNGIQSMLFVVLWKSIEEKWKSNTTV